MHVPFTYQGGYDAGVQLMSGSRLPRAILAASDQIAIGMLAAFTRAGTRVPDDVAIVSFDGTDVADFVWPRLTTAVQPLEEMADAAVRALLRPEDGRGHRAFTTTLRVRESCGCTAD